MKKHSKKEYAEIWIKNYESRKDTFRVKYLEPFLRSHIKKLPENAKVLDVGCGWGTIIKFLKPSHEYTGVDPNKYFFSYIRRKYSNREMTLLYGKLPSKLPVPDNYFDLVVCSMTLHLVESLENSIKTLFSKVKKGGKLLIVDFRDKAEKVIREKIYPVVCEETENHIKGISILPSGLKVCNEAFFHKEKNIEKIISSLNCRFIKRYLGDFFVAYEIKK